MHVNSSWREIVKLGKSEVIYWLDSFSLDYIEDINYFKLCSILYQHIKQMRVEQVIPTRSIAPTVTLSAQSSPVIPTEVEEPDDDVLVDVDFHSNLSFRDLQLHSIGKLHREPMPIAAPPKQQEPKPSRYCVLRTHYNNTGYYCGMRVKRLLCKDLSTGLEEWLGSNDLDNIQVGDIVQDSTGVGFVVPVNRTAKV